MPLACRHWRPDLVRANVELIATSEGRNRSRPRCGRPPQSGLSRRPRAASSSSEYNGATSLFTNTKRIVGLCAASQIASTSAASFFCCESRAFRLSPRPRAAERLQGSYSPDVTGPQCQPPPECHIGNEARSLCSPASESTGCCRSCGTLSRPTICDPEPAPCCTAEWTVPSSMPPTTAPRLTPRAV